MAGADVVLFCVKSGDTETVGRAIATFLAPDASVLSFQNGVDSPERLQAVLGRWYRWPFTSPPGCPGPATSGITAAAMW